MGGPSSEISVHYSTLANSIANLRKLTTSLNNSRNLPYIKVTKHRQRTLKNNYHNQKTQTKNNLS